MRFLAAYIMKGRIQAMTVAATLALLSLPFFPVSFVSSAAVALVTLRLGGREGLYVLSCACLAAALFCMLLIGSTQFALLYGVLLLLLWVPIWLISIVLREGRQLVVAIETVVLLGVAVVLAIYVYHPEPAQIWREVLPVMVQLMQQAQPDFQATIDKESLEALAHRMTGNLAAGSVTSLLFGLLLARWWQALLYNPGGFRAEFLALKGHAQLAMLTAVTLAVAMLASGWIGELCGNVLWVLLVLYIFIGIAVMHSVLAAMKGRDYMVPLFYVTLLIMPPIMGVLALFGLSDTWLDLRNKLKPNGA